MSDFVKAVQERVVIYDGAMGTCIHQFNPTIDDYWGKENCSEILNLSRPDIIRQIHASYFEAGADIVETNTFGSSRIVLNEFQLGDKVEEINRKAVEIAKEVAVSYSTNGRKRFVAGSIGPTTKLPSLGHITLDDMVAVFTEQTIPLIEAGVDVLLIETCQDVLQTKCAIIGCLDAMKKTGKQVPIQAQVTLANLEGTMLLGTDIGAALTALEPYDIFAIGLNCSTGPQEMNDAVRYLGLNSPKPVCVLPNAGLPENVGGSTVYRLGARELADYHKHFITDYGVRIVGGCCGTTPQHIKAVVETCANLEPAKRDVKPVGSASSAFTMVPLDLEPKPLIVAEEMNTTTRKAEFREFVRSGNYEEILSLAKRLVAEGSHMLDVCCAIVGEDEDAYMDAVMEKVATRVPAPVVVDSTEANVIETALKRIPGKAIINSINLEDGEKRTSKVLPMAKRYGAAVVALTIDEQGMALTADRKVEIAKRIFDLAVNKYGIRPVDLIFDALTLPISTGQEEYRTAGIETLNAVRRIKEELPECHTILGVSNISFGLSAYSRRILNSVFMHEAVNNGLDMAIVNYSKIYPLYKIPEAEVELARKLIYHDRTNGDPLQVFMQHFSGSEKKTEQTASETDALSVEDKLKHLIVNGERAIGAGDKRVPLEVVLEDALQRYTPLDLINTVLLDGMKTVGELFGARKMQLPSVLDAAGVMKAAVAYLEPKMEKKEGGQKGTIVIATVKGDVHDIGKNLVDIILSNNGYKVVNLGIKQPAETIIHAAKEHNAHAIGLSGLLVKSTLEMKYVLQDLQLQKLEYPVICGGAALTRKYVEDDLRREYSHSVFYANDAFDGLHVMDDLTSEDGARDERLADGRKIMADSKAAAAAAARAAAAAAPVSTERSTAIGSAPNIPQAPFHGIRVRKDYDLREVFKYINETALFKNQWQLKMASQEDYARLVEEKYRGILHELQDEVIEKAWYAPQAVYGFFPCQSEGNDVIIYDPEYLSVQKSVSGAATVDQALKSEGLPAELLRFTFPRQREGRKLAIADYFLPKSSGQMDVIGLSLVTIGPRASEETQKLFQSGEYTRYLYHHGLSVETAEALAELVHKNIREELGIAGYDSHRINDLFHQKYRGSRYSFGYPACPHLEDQTKLFQLLKPEENVGVRLTTGYLLEPEQSTSAIVVHHPEAKYFVV